MEVRSILHQLRSMVAQSHVQHPNLSRQGEVSFYAALQMAPSPAVFTVRSVHVCGYVSSKQAIQRTAFHSSSVSSIRRVLKDCVASFRNMQRHVIPVLRIVALQVGRIQMAGVCFLIGCEQNADDRHRFMVVQMRY